MLSGLLPTVFNGLVFGSILYLIAIGLTLQFSVLNLINFSHALFFVASGLLVTSLIDSVGKLVIIGGSIIPFVVLSIVTLSIMVSIGYLLERYFLSNYLYDIGFDYQMLSTFGILLMGIAGTSSIWGSSGSGLQGPLSPGKVMGQITVTGVTFSNFSIFTIIVTALVIISLYVLFDRTSLGKVAHAVSQDEDMARIIGVDISKINGITFAVATGTASLAGILFVGGGTVAPEMAVDFVLLGYIVAVIGGISSMRGAVVGAVILGVVRSLGIRFVPDLELALAFLLMALIILVRPNGLIQKEGIR